MEHREIPNAHLHEPKGVSTATAGQVYIADGSGSGAWSDLPGILRGSAFPLATVMPYTGAEEPIGWMFCDGRELSRTEFSELFFIIGTIFGIGNGVNTFNLPDLRGRVTANKNQGTGRLTSAGGGVNGDNVGAAGGSSTTPLTIQNIPSMSATTSSSGAHVHPLNEDSILRVRSGPVQMQGSGNDGGANITSTSAGNHTHNLTLNNGSSNNPHNNIMPTIVLNYIIYHGLDL